MSFKDYLHESAQSSRHNETHAYIIFVTGILYFIGGVLASLKLAKSPKWFMFIPYHTEPLGGAVLGLALTISGLTLIVYAIVAGSKYRNDRRWYMQEMRKATAFQEIALKAKKQSINLETHPQKVQKRTEEFKIKYFLWRKEQLKDKENQLKKE